MSGPTDQMDDEYLDGEQNVRRRSRGRRDILSSVDDCWCGRAWTNSNTGAYGTVTPLGSGAKSGECDCICCTDRDGNISRAYQSLGGRRTRREVQVLRLACLCPKLLPCSTPGGPSARRSAAAGYMLRSVRQYLLCILYSAYLSSPFFRRRIPHSHRLPMCRRHLLVFAPASTKTRLLLPACSLDLLLPRRHAAKEPKCMALTCHSDWLAAVGSVG